MSSKRKSFSVAGVRVALVPERRFPEFANTAGWDTAAGDQLFQQISNREAPRGLPILAITQEHGAIPRDMIDYHVSVADQSVEAYKEVKPGDFIISLRSFQGGIEYSSYHGICSPAYVILRKRVELSDEFYKQHFKSHSFIQQLTRNLEGLRDGKMISYKQFSELRLLNPSLPEQQKIAGCLASVDALIENQRRKVEALKAHKKGLMQQLFPQEGETQPRLRFPEFEGAGEWVEHPLEEFVARSFYGTSSSTSQTGRYPVLRMGNMVEGDIDFSNLVYIDLDDITFGSLRLEVGDILLNRTNSPALVGKISLFRSDWECITASYIVTYRLKKTRLNPSFCNAMLNTEVYQAKIKKLAKPSISQANINPTAFKKEVVISVPSLFEQQRIADCLTTLDELIAAEAQKLAMLKTHKKGLMQQLFPSVSGKDA